MKNNRPRFLCIIIIWKYFLLLASVSVFSCTEQGNNKKTVAALPTGKWKIIQLKNAGKLIAYDTSRTYILEFAANKNLMLMAEDNRLSGEMIFINNNSFKLSNTTVTDVCCNSENARTLFKFFEDTGVSINYDNHGDKLVLSAGKTVVALEK